MANAMPMAPATASRAMSCQPDGLKRSGPLRTGALGLPFRARRAGSRSQYRDFESARLPAGAIQRIARVEHPLAADQGGYQVYVELLERAMVDQQHDRFGVAQRLLERQQGRRQAGR